MSSNIDKNAIKFDIIKELMIENLKRLVYDHFYGKINFEIKYDDDKIYIIDRANGENILYENYISELDADLWFQKYFIARLIKVLFNTSWVETICKDDSDHESSFITPDNDHRYFDIVGEGYICKNHFIDLETKFEEYISRKNQNEEYDGDEEYEECDEFEYIFYTNLMRDMIQNNLDEDKIRVVYDEQENGFWVCEVIEKIDLEILAIEDLDAILDENDHVKNINDLDWDELYESEVEFFYSTVLNKEVKEAIRFIENL